MEDSIYPILTFYNGKKLIVYECSNCKHKFLSKKGNCDYCDEISNDNEFEKIENMIFYEFQKLENQPLVFF
jgi:hypothetical protein